MSQQNPFQDVLYRSDQSSGSNKISSPPFRPNNVVFQKYDSKPYTNDLNHLVKQDSNRYQFQQNMPQLFSHQQKIGSGGSLYHQNPIDNVLRHNSNMYSQKSRPVKGQTYESGGMTPVGLSQHQKEERNSALSRMKELEERKELQDEENRLQSRSKQSQRQLPPLAQSQSQNTHSVKGDQIRGSQQEMRESQAMSKYSGGKELFERASQQEISNKSEIGKVTNQLRHKYNFNNEVDEESFHQNIMKYEENQDEEANIQTLEERINEMKSHLEQAKFKYEQKQLYELEQKEYTLLNKIDDLEKQALDDHEWNLKMRDQLIQFRLQQQAIEKQEKEFDEYMWKVERETEVEKLVRKKLEIEKMKQQQDLLDELLRKKEVEVGQIGEEMDKKDYSSAALLKKALERADILQKQIEGGALDQKTQALLVETILEKGEDSKKIREQILEEIKGKMVRDQEDQKYRNEEFIQQLNEQRLKFMEAEKVIQEKKMIHQEIMRRGLDFLTEVELGNAPPLEYVVQNIQQNKKDKGEDLYIQPQRPQDTVKQVQQTLEEQEDRLKALMDDYLITQNMIEEENPAPVYNEYLENIYVSDDMREFIEPMIYDMVFKAAEIGFQKSQVAIETKKDINRLRTQYEIRGARIDDITKQISLKEVNEDLIEYIIKEMLRKVASESIKINELASNKALEVIIKALRTQKGFKNSDRDMKKILTNMHSKHNEERKRDIHKVHHTLFVLGSKAVPRLAEIQIKGAEQPTEKQKKIKDEEYIDEDAEVLDPNECLAFVNNDDIKDLELDYFSLINQDSFGLFGGSKGEKSGGVLAFDISKNGRLMALALNNGIILVYDTKNESLVRILGNVPKMQHIEFSRDNFSQIMGLTIEGMAKTYLMKGKISMADPETSNYVDPKSMLEDRPLELIPYYDVNHTLFINADEKNDKGANKNFLIQSATLHPSCSFTGFQHSIMLGTKSGTIMRWISNVGPDFMHKEALLFNRMYGNGMLTSADAPFIDKKHTTAKPRGFQKDYIKETNRPYQLAPVSEEFVQREFFIAHKVAVLYLCFIENSHSVVSIDMNGHVFVWKYEKEFLQTNQIFEPSGKFRIAMEFTKFIRESETLVFPGPKDKKIDAAKALTANVLKKIEDYMKNSIDMKIIERKAIDKIFNSKGVHTFTLPSGQPLSGELANSFEEFVFNSQMKLTKRAIVKFTPEESLAKIGKVKFTKNQRFIIIQLLKEHIFGAKEQQTSEFVIFRTQEQKLNKIKVILNFEKTVPYDFDISDEYQSLEFPYLYFLCGTTVQIVSMLTSKNN